ncbi:Teichoic acids export ATP-binding protein TagH [Azoarcus sp. Aa7]|nr:Teichoic acids export ATP-binding protein TagH [Azoarcus sp. Aa7]
MSSSDIAIRVSGLCKCYEIYDTPRDRLKQFVVPKLRGAVSPLRKLFPPGKSVLPTYYREFWALKDVSFEVKSGETVGIIGCNGSGKSTLLQLICGTLSPTGGSVETHGRIAALLELGSGFNPEFTGRENVYMNAAVLGLSKYEIDNRFDDIAGFADIGKFIEQPVKTYSSGMALRLAFAVAINVVPKILVVDEALSVGDERFQRKCFSRIEEIRAGGATILFVSHSGGAIVELCDRAILLDGGELLASGAPKQVVGRYQKLLYAPAAKREVIREQMREGLSPCDADGRGKDGTLGLVDYGAARQSEAVHASFDPDLVPSSTIEYETHGAVIESPQIQTLRGEPVNNLVRGESYRYIYTVRFSNPASNVRFGMLIKTISGIELGGGISAPTIAEAISFVEAGQTLRVEFRFNANLNPGVYFMNAGVTGQISDSGEDFLHRLVDIVMFRILAESENCATALVDFGCVAKVA